MIEVNGLRIEDSIIDILYELRRDLLTHNINKLNDIIIKGPNALITCPSHRDGKESHPSCYVRLEENNKVNEGIVHCFTCGYKVPFDLFISNCFDSDDIKVGRDWLLNHCHTSYLSEIRNINRIVINKKESKQINNYVSEDELKSYRYYHPYMFKRGLTKEIINKFDIGFDKKTNCITFPVYDTNNKCLFVVKRNVSYKKFYIPKNINKGIFGINQLPKGCNNVVICESVFNALTAYKYGYYALALFGTGSEEQYKLLKSLNIRRYILAFDGDDAGRKGAKKFKQNIKESLITDLILPKGKDLNDLSKNEFNSLFNSVL